MKMKREINQYINKAVEQTANINPNSFANLLSLQTAMKNENQVSGM